VDQFVRSKVYDLDRSVVFRCEKQSLSRGVQMKMVEVAIANPRKCNRLDKFEWLINSLASRSNRTQEDHGQAGGN
jgi:hypothetical protein